MLLHPLFHLPLVCLFSLIKLLLFFGEHLPLFHGTKDDLVEFVLLFFLELLVLTLGFLLLHLFFFLIIFSLLFGLLFLGMLELIQLLLSLSQLLVVDGLSLVQALLLTLLNTSLSSSFLIFLGFCHF